MKTDTYINMTLPLPGGGEYSIDDEVDIMPAILSADLTQADSTLENNLTTLRKYLVILFGELAVGSMFLNCIEITIFKLILFYADQESECPSVISCVTLSTSRTRWAYSLRGWRGKLKANKDMRLKSRKDRCQKIAEKPTKAPDGDEFPPWDWGNCAEFQLFASLTPCK